MQSPDTSTKPNTKSNTTLEFDLVIIGGGVAGLWLLNRLCNAGYNAVLFEQNELGAGQSVASQGMIHGGVKYTLSGALSGSSEAIADMPAYWQRCLAGKGDVDLSQAQTLSDHFYMWSTANSLSKMTTFFASKALRGRVHKLAKEQFPAVFNNKNFKGQLYQLLDNVIGTPSLLANLAQNQQGRIFSINWNNSQLQIENQKVSLQLNTDTNAHINIKAKQFIFSAGKGNQDLLEAVSADKPVMQLRPLRQVMVKHNHDYPLYAHCIGTDSTPRLTISSHRCDDGKMCWYLGGQLSEAGVNKSSEQLIQEAKQELHKLFPWLDWSKSQWKTFYIERAEPKQKNFARPEEAFIGQAFSGKTALGNVAVAWPTKLTLVPNLGDATLQFLLQQGIQPDKNMGNGIKSLQEKLKIPNVAKSPWNTMTDEDWLP